MDFPPRVASVEIDAKAVKVVALDNCTVDRLKTGAAGKLEFRQTDKALPFFPAEATRRS